MHALVARSSFSSQNVKNWWSQATFVKMSKNGTPLWREGHFQVKKQNTSVSKCILEVRMSKKRHATVARRTFSSQKTKHFSVKIHFGSADVKKKKARHCGAKDIFKSKKQNTSVSKCILEVRMSKKGTPLWREGHLFSNFSSQKTKHFSVKIHFGSADVKKKARHCGAKDIFKSKNKTLQCQNAFWKCGCQKKKARHCGAKDIFKSKKQNTSVSKCILEVRMSKKGTPLWREGHLFSNFSSQKTKHFSVKIHFGSADVKKGHATVARRTFSSQKTKHFSVKMHFGSADVKKGHVTVARRAFSSQKTKHFSVKMHFGSADVKKRHATVARRAFSSQKTKHFSVKIHFGSADVKKGHATVARRAFSSQKTKHFSVKMHFGSADVKKKHATVARRAFSSQKTKHFSVKNCQNAFWKCGCQKKARHCGANHIFKSKNKTLQCQNAFWKGGCQKMPPGCGAKRIFKSKCTKHLSVSVGVFLEVRMARINLEMLKT